ncbi:MAG TPA: hypothetical protein VFR58_08170 [Flavisolibacter sp.]|nr:hypothetical protein [Flavisolibacter sp.]
MKTRPFAAITAILLIAVILSCNLFRSSKPKPPALVGEWRLDSVAVAGNDTSLGYGLLLATLYSDTADVRVVFDSSHIITRYPDGETDTAGYRFNDTTGQLVFPGVREDRVFWFRPAGDSAAILIDNDSSRIYLKRQ